MGKANDGYPAPPGSSRGPPTGRQKHTNAFTRAAELREVDEQQMQNLLKSAQRHARVYNPDIEPEHERDIGCSCTTCTYR